MAFCFRLSRYSWWEMAITCAMMSSSSQSANTRTHSSYSSGQTSREVMGVQCPRTHTVPTALDRQVGQPWEFSVRKHTHTQFLQLRTDKSGSHGSSMSTNTHTHSAYSSGQTSRAVTGVQRLQTHAHTHTQSSYSSGQTSWAVMGVQCLQTHTHTQFLQLWPDKPGSNWSSISANTHSSVSCGHPSLAVWSSESITPQEISQPLPPHKMKYIIKV